MLNEFTQHFNGEDEPEFMPLFSLEDEDDAQRDEVFADVLPLLALKNTILFPGVVIPITVGRQKSIEAINKAYESGRIIAVLSQEDSRVENPALSDLYPVGTIARIVKILRMPDGGITAILQGRRRFRVHRLVQDEPYMIGEITPLTDVVSDNPMEFEATISSVKDVARQIIELSPNIPNEAQVMLRNINDPSRLLSFIANNMNAKVSSKQQILEEDALQKRAEMILAQISAELQLLELKDQIEGKVRGELEKQQRDYFLNQQLKTIQEELGQNTHEDELKALGERAKAKKWSSEAAKVFERELNKIRRINPQVAEYSILFNYLETMLDLPWDETTEDNFDLNKVKTVLDEDHFGLEKVKERILEHLAVLKLKKDMKAPIICLAGPPGVGKTSLGASIAKALNRKYVRVSLGGLHDEAEIRGHRKTYIGALPGRIIQSIKKAGASNPVFILDEIDKIGNSFRGDPSSALLEVLDPEQNGTFYDNYLEMEYDLSKVLFIATANYLSDIQPALLDRMEVIHLSGYSIEEKIEIAERHLIPTQRVAHGLEDGQATLDSEMVEKVIEGYTREPGVRNLNRKIGGLMRAVAKKVAMEETYIPAISAADIEKTLGKRVFHNDSYEDGLPVGVVIGLAWTSVGGDILYIETNKSKGTGLTLTGNLGNVMSESATTALSFLKANAEQLGFEPTVIEQHNIHIHVPEGGTPKDGPSAGISMMTAMASVITNRPVKPHLAMTGEITLRGKVLPVGGIKEKILAARRAGIKEIILCKENMKDIEEIEQAYIKDLTFHYVSRMTEVLDIALMPVLEALSQLSPKAKDEKSKKVKQKKASSPIPTFPEGEGVNRNF